MLGFCKNCHKLKEIKARWLCSACYTRKKRKGTLNRYKPMKKRYTHCIECKRERKIHARGLCSVCYRKGRVLKKVINKKSIQVFAPSKKEASKYYDKAKDEIYTDIIKNPRKWLDKIKIQNG